MRLSSAWRSFKDRSMTRRASQKPLLFMWNGHARIPSARRMPAWDLQEASVRRVLEDQEDHHRREDSKDLLHQEGISDQIEASEDESHLRHVGSTDRLTHHLEIVARHTGFLQDPIDSTTEDQSMTDGAQAHKTPDTENPALTMDQGMMMGLDAIMGHHAEASAVAVVEVLEDAVVRTLLVRLSS